MLYRTTCNPLGGTRYDELIRQVRRFYHSIEKQTRRRPYIRSPYFNKQKVFFDYFWRHLDQKAPRIRRQRLRYFPCGIELVANNRCQPSIHRNPNRPHETFYRFEGITPNNQLFSVQIKQDMKSNHKYLMSIFPK